MSRTTRKRITYNYESDTYELDRNARDNKGRCHCCGNSHQKQQNKRDRAAIKRNLHNHSQ